MESNLNEINFGKTIITTPQAPSRTYYQHPTPQDMLFEEEIHNTMANFSAKTIYEQYIDSMSEYQILTQLYRMTIYVTVVGFLLV